MGEEVFSLFVGDVVQSERVLLTGEPFDCVVADGFVKVLFEVGFVEY